MNSAFGHGSSMSRMKSSTSGKVRKVKRQSAWAAVLAERTADPVFVRCLEIELPEPVAFDGNAIRNIVLMG
jgi:hypothetical protein